MACDACDLNPFVRIIHDEDDVAPAPPSKPAVRRAEVVDEGGAPSRLAQSPQERPA